MITMHLQIRKSLISVGIILFILIIPLMWLSGSIISANEEETNPEPITSSEIVTDSSVKQVDQTAHSFSENRDAFEPLDDTFIFLSLVVKPFKNDPSTYMNALELAVLDLVNIERDKAGCGPVEGEPHLKDAAFRQSQDMADNQGEIISHTGSDDSNFIIRAADAGYEGFAAGENIAAGYPTAQSVMTGWMNSSGHRNNILNCSHTHIGISYHLENNSYYRHYWTQVFGHE